jgi:hypothetical protein
MSGFGIVMVLLAWYFFGALEIGGGWLHTVGA